LIKTIERIKVKESTEELRKEKEKYQIGSSKHKKVRMLIFMTDLNSRCETITCYSKALKIDRHTVRNWVTKYKEGGFSKLMSNGGQKNARTIMNDKMEKFIISQVNNESEKVKYSKVLTLVNKKFQINMKYPTLYKFARKFSFQK
jgi:transposase